MTRTSHATIPAGACLLHIGPPKTGSTALQAALEAQGDELARYDAMVLANDARHRRAVHATMTAADDDSAESAAAGDDWQELARRVLAAPDRRICISNEVMARAEPERVRVAVRDLGGDRTHVVAAARRLDRLLPSHWQEQVRAGKTAQPFGEWLTTVLGDHREDPAWSDFWYPHDLNGLAGRWIEATSPDRFTFVVLGEDDRTSLSRGIEQLLGLPEGLLAPDPTHRANPSVSLARVEFVRVLSQALESKDWPDTVVGPIRARVAKRIRAAEAWAGEGGALSALPGWAVPRVQELNEERAELVRSLGVGVIGDPDHLRTPDLEHSNESAAAAPDALVSTELAVNAVVDAIGGAVQAVRSQQAEDRRTIQRLRKRLRRQGADSGADAATAATGLKGKLLRGVVRKESGR